MTSPAPLHAPTARDMNQALYRHFWPRYVVLTEVTTGEEEATEGLWARDRRCDVLLVSKIERINVEVKVSRSDFLQDVARPGKQAAWNAITHRRAYAVPAGLVRPEEVPDGYGLLEVTLGGGRPTVAWKRRAPKIAGHTPPDALPSRVLHTLLHRLAMADAAMKGHGWDPASEDAGELRARVKRLESDLEKERNRTHRAVEVSDLWKRAYGAGQPVTCRTCGNPLTVSVQKYTPWKHRQPADEVTCRAMREEEDRQQAIANGYHRAEGRVYVRPPEPVDQPSDVQPHPSLAQSGPVENEPDAD